MKEQKRKQQPLLERLYTTLNVYLEESSVHGLRYLARRRGDGEDASRSCVDMAFWTAVLATTFIIAIVFIRNSLREAHDFPVITTVDRILINDVPFPAVTVDAGEVLNPWGYVEKVLGAVDYQCFDHPFDCPAEKVALREDFHFLLKKVAERYFGAALDKLKGEPLDALRERREDLYMAKEIWFPEFERAAAILAHVFERKRSRSLAVLRKFAEATARDFAKFTPTKLELSKGWGTKAFLPVVLDEAGWLGVTDADAAPCLEDAGACPNATYRSEAYALMLLPFYFNQMPSDNMRLGEVISYFSRRVLSTKTSRDFTLFLSRSGDNNYDDVIKMATFLENLTNRVAEQPINVTTFEAAKLLDRPYYNMGSREGQVNYIGARFDCASGRDFNTEVANYYDAWEDYVKPPENLMVGSQTVWSVAEAPCTNDTQDRAFGISGCCALSRVMRQEQELSMKVMKQAMQPPHFLGNKEERESDLKDAVRVLPYPLKPLEEELEEWNSNPRIHMCQYDNQPAEDSMHLCKLFVRSYTNEGFGYTFNNRLFWNKHQADNRFNQRFYQLMSPFFQDSEEQDIRYPRSSGSFYGLQVVLHLNQYEEAARTANRRHVVPAFRVTLHDPHKPADLRSEGIEVKPGYASTFLVTPSQVVTSDSVGDLDLERRQCKFHYESDSLQGRIS